MGDSFNTRLGGILSILFKILLFSFFISKIDSWVNLTNNSYGYLKIPINDQVKRIEMSKEDLMIYYVYKSVGRGALMTYNSTEWGRYFKLKVYVSTINAAGN